MTAIEFYRDDNGMPRARGTDSQLAVFLETDCQSASHHVTEILQALERGEEGQFIGNAHELSLDRTRATLTAMYDDQAPARHMSTTYLRDVLGRWLEFVTT